MRIRIGFKAWLVINDKHLIGKGGADILRAIKETGSISAAAKKLGLSYQFAWKYIKEVEETLKKPIVETWKGGTKGGGAKLTEYGDKLLEVYDYINKTLEEVIKKLERELHENYVILFEC